MRGGGLDRLVTFTRPSAPSRVGRSRVQDQTEEVAADVPCRIEAGVGTERFASAENAASAPFVIRCRREPDVETLDAGDLAIDEDQHVYDIKSVRPALKDPRRELEILAVRKAG